MSMEGDPHTTHEVESLLGVTQGTASRALHRFPQRLEVRKDGHGHYVWTPEDIATLRQLLIESQPRRPRLSTRQAATLAGISYPRLLSLIRRRRHELPVVKETGFLDWTPGAVAVLRALVARWRAKGTDDRPLPETAVIRTLPVYGLVLAAPLPVGLSFSRTLGVTARLALLGVQAQGPHPRAAVALLRRHLEARYRELEADPRQAPELWAGLQKLITPRRRKRKRRSRGRRAGARPRSSKEG
jgi:hypothetical protein